MSYLADRASEALHELISADEEGFFSALNDFSVEELQQLAQNLAYFHWHVENRLETMRNLGGSRTESP